MESKEFIKGVEVEPKLLFKVTLMRHEKPFYKDEGHDLTPEGVENAIRKGKKIREDGTISENDDIILVHSPARRAKGTIDFVAESAGLKDVPKTEIDQLRSSDLNDLDTIIEYFNKSSTSPEKLAEDHYKDPLFNERPDIIEPQQNKKERLYRSFEYLIRWFEKHPPEDKTPHVIAVSHFEVITHIIDDVFGIENVGKYNVPSFGESVYIEAYESDKKSIIKLKVTFDGKTKEVIFDRSDRSVKIEE
ncbi:MAG: histidine phosphatase family protein [Candidatus Paceibacterota bacterium]|jgi:broad specificity phosphatase PhoE